MTHSCCDASLACSRTVAGCDPVVIGRPCGQSRQREGDRLTGRPGANRLGQCTREGRKCRIRTPLESGRRRKAVRRHVRVESRTGRRHRGRRKGRHRRIGTGRGGREVRDRALCGSFRVYSTDVVGLWTNTHIPVSIWFA